MWFETIQLSKELQISYYKYVAEKLNHTFTDTINTKRSSGQELA